MSDVNPTRVDILSLSDDDFGSKYGRDRTAKEVATKNANDTAGYKAAEADFKKVSKAANAEERKQNADVLRAERAYRKENSIPQNFKTHPGHYHMEGGPKAPSGGGGSGGAGIPKVGPKKPLDMKKGGVVSSASKRADGCAIKGKTKGRMV
jgi:hypothetical protein